MYRTVVALLISLIIISGCEPVGISANKTAREINANLVDNPEYAGAVVAMVRHSVNSFTKNPSHVISGIHTGKPPYGAGDNISLWIYDLEGKVVVERKDYRNMPMPGSKTRTDIIRAAMNDGEGWVEFSLAATNGGNNAKSYKIYFKRATADSGKEFIVCGAYRLY